MAGSRRIWLKALVAVAVLFVLAAVALKLYVTKERVLAWIEPPLEEALGREVQIGDVSVGFTGFDLVEFSVASNVGETPLFEVARVEISWELMKLVSGELEVARASVEAPKITLTRLADGSLEIDDLLKGGGDKAGQVESEAAGAKAETSASEVRIGSFTLSGGSLTFIDLSVNPHESYSVEGLYLSLVDFSTLRASRFELGALISPLGKAPLKVAGTLDASKAAVDAEATLGPLELKALNEFISKGEGLALAGGSGEVRAAVKVTGGEPRPLSAKVSLKKLILADGSAKGEPADIDLTLTVQTEEQFITVERFDLAVNGQTLGGSAKVTLGEAVYADAQAESPELLVDELLTIMPAAEGAQATKGAAANNSGKPTGSGKNSEASTQATLNLKVGRLVASGFTFDDLDLKASFMDGVLRVEPLKSGFYGGKISIDASADTVAAPAPIRALAKMEGVRLEHLLPVLSPTFAGTLTGATKMTLDASASGSGVKGIAATLTGEVGEGKLVGSPLAERLAALFNSDGLRELNFYSLSWGVKLKDAVAKVEKLELDGRELSLTGSGEVAVEDQSLGFDLKVSVPQHTAYGLIRDRNILQALTDKEGRVGIPIKVTGTAAEPRYALDAKALEKVAGKAAKKAVKKEVKKLIEKKGGKLAPVENILPGLMDKLFGD